MKLPTMFVVVVLLAPLCSAQPIVTSETEQPHTSGVLWLKRQAIMNGGQVECSEGQINVNIFCIDEKKYRKMKGDYDDSEPEQPHTSGVVRLKRQRTIYVSECPKGYIKVNGFCLDEEKYWQIKGDYDDSEPEQPYTSGVLRLKRQAPAIMHGSGECPKGQIKVKDFCIDEGKYWEMKGDYDDSEEE